MAYEGKLGTIEGAVAAADLSAKQFYFVRLDTSGKIAAVTATASTPIGVLQDKPSAADAAANVAPIGGGGVSKLKLGAAATAGNRLFAASDGAGTPTSAAGGAPGAVAMATGAAGDIIPVLLDRVVTL